MTYPDGSKYDGNWENSGEGYSLKQGQGVMTYPDGRREEGLFKDGIF